MLIISIKIPHSRTLRNIKKLSSKKHIYNTDVKRELPEQACPVAGLKNEEGEWMSESHRLVSVGTGDGLQQTGFSPLQKHIKGGKGVEYVCVGNIRCHVFSTSVLLTVITHTNIFKLYNNRENEFKQ